MASSTGERDDVQNRLRQQLLLAQVRVMEIEDVRDNLATQLAETDRRLAEAQTLADAKLDQAAHLERVVADLQAQFAHLRHQQHVTHEALNAARDEFAQAALSLRNEREVTTGLQLQLVAHNATIRELTERAAALAAESAAHAAKSAERAAQIEHLERNRRAMQASRSWRWTAWLRSLERTFGAKR